MASITNFLEMKKRPIWGHSINKLPDGRFMKSISATSQRTGCRA